MGFGDAYRQRYAKAVEGTSIPITVERDGRTVELSGPLRFQIRIDGRLEPDPAASGKPLRIRNGILNGRTDR
jgi:hypothetical protein